MIEKITNVKLKEESSILNDLEIVMPCDVTNPLLGLKGAAYVFGPQKGAKLNELPFFDEQIAKIIKLYLKGRHPDTYEQEFKRIQHIPGTGASGGIVGAILACFDKGHIVSGMDFITEQCNLDEEIANSDVILTGEGSIDKTTMEGKVVHKIHELCMKY